MQSVKELEQQRQNALAEMEVVDTELTSLRDQIERAKSAKVATGSASDRDWWARVNSRLRHRGRERQDLQHQLGELNRALKTARHVANSALTEDAFVRVARERLPANVFTALMKEANERRAAHA